MFPSHLSKDFFAAALQRYIFHKVIKIEIFTFNCLIFDVTKKLWDYSLSCFNGESQGCRKFYNASGKMVLQLYEENFKNIVLFPPECYQYSRTISYKNISNAITHFTFCWRWCRKHANKLKSTLRHFWSSPRVCRIIIVISLISNDK